MEEKRENLCLLPVATFSAIRIICLRMKAINPLHSNENPKKFQTQLIEMNRRLYRSLKFITENSLMPDSVSIFFSLSFLLQRLSIA